MKKTVKSLIIAASVAAIAGIGAVSFAAWQAQGASTGTANGSVGNVVSTIGTITVKYNDAALAEGNKVNDLLVPYDQDLTNKTAGQAVVAAAGSGVNNVKFMVFTVTNSEAAHETNVVYKISGALTKGTEDNAGELGDAQLYYKVLGDSETAAAPVLTGEQTLTTAGYTAMEADADDAEALAGFASGKKVIVILDATASEAVGATWEITFTAEQGVAE